MITYLTGNLFESEAEAYVNTVNTVGVMGKGIALQFKKHFPDNFKLYKKACENEEVKIGKMFVTEAQAMFQGKKTIINFPTKTHWKKPSEYSYIEEGLQDLVDVIKERNIQSIAIPPLGAGNGGLNWSKVTVLLEKYLQNINCEVQIYQPTNEIKEVLKKERVKLTPARAMLLAMLYELVRNGEIVSEFAAEKIAYFLQRFGGQDAFKLDFKPNFYGPYSGKVRHVLYYLNGSYITGYSSKDKKPFEGLGLVPDGEEQVNEFLNKDENKAFTEIVEKTKQFLEGFYSPFGLELLSTIDFIISDKKTNDIDRITERLENWSNRKKTKFTNPKFVEIATKNINQHLYV